MQLKQVEPIKIWLKRMHKRYLKMRKLFHKYNKELNYWHCQVSLSLAQINDLPV